MDYDHTYIQGCSFHIRFKKVPIHDLESKVSLEPDGVMKQQCLNCLIRDLLKQKRKVCRTEEGRTVPITDVAGITVTGHRRPIAELIKH